PPAIDGRPVRVRDARVRPAGPGVEVELTLAEGRQRTVRRLADALGLKVEWLHRVAYGPVRLGRLAEGKHRRLSPQEVEAIERLHGTACPTSAVLRRERAGRHAVARRLLAAAARRIVLVALDERSEGHTSELQS